MNLALGSRATPSSGILWKNARNLNPIHETHTEGSSQHVHYSPWKRVTTLLKVNLFTPEVRDNPYPTYEMLRTQDPIHRSFIGNYWVLTRYRDVQAALLDQRFSSNERLQSIKEKQQYVSQKGGDLTTLVQACHSALFFLDPPDHTRLRRLVKQGHRSGDRSFENVPT